MIQHLVKLPFFKRLIPSLGMKVLRLIKKNKGYYWDKNFGYGTKQHLRALKKLGITKHHRKTFSPASKISTHNI